MMNILILGGTRDAMNLADQLLNQPELSPTYSLAGRTRRPLPPSLPTRRGGFGGIEGLKDWLRDNQTHAVVDATHPFAAEMSHNAAIACRELNLPLAQLTRQPWEENPGDQWHRVDNLHQAAQTLSAITAPSDTILITTGRTSLAPFEGISQRHLVVRCVDPPNPEPAFESWTLIEDRGPYQLERERELFREHHVRALVSKNSGGQAARPKLDAAREATIPVVMIDRPTTPPADVVLYTPEAVTEWLRTQANDTQT